MPAAISKEHVIVSGTDANHAYDDVVSPSVPAKFRGTMYDREDMAMLGKKQVLRRNFKGLTMLGFASMVMVSWEALLVYIAYPLTDGGTAIVFWGAIIAPICLTFVYLSLAELASM
jgi:choline transport protein